MNKSAPVHFVLFTLTLGLLSACDGGGGDPVDTSKKVTTLNDSGAGSLRQLLTDAKAGDTIKFATTGTVTLASALTPSQNVTIDATGVTFDAAGKGRVLEVPAGVTVTLKGGTLKGGVGQVMAASLQATEVQPGERKMQAQADAKPTYGGVIMNEGTLILEDVTVTGGKANLGGGIYNVKDAVLTLKTGTKINGNAAVRSDFDGAAGGGIYNAGTLTVSGAAIEENNAYYGGGGIRNTGSATLNMQSGSVSSNACTMPFTGTSSQDARGCSGGGIHTSGVVNISGGSISNNSATYYGAGVTAQVLCKDSQCKPEEYLYSTLTMSGGTISGNKTTGTADNAGGGLWLRAKSSITGGTISGNSSMYGGGIHNWHELSLTGGTIENNTATQNGGGIGSNIPQNAGVQLKFGGTAKLQNNTAVNSGGGLALGSYTQALMDGGTIMGNKVTGTTDGGGGVRVFVNARLTLSGGEIKGNTALLNGGGVTVGGQMNMTGGSITGNSTTGTGTSQGRGGGVHMYSNATLTASGGSISGNTVTLQGGGVYVGGSVKDDKGATIPAAKFTLSGAKIENNKVTIGGGGGVLLNGLMTMSSGSITGNTVGGIESGQGRGGGVRVNSRAEFTATGGTITNNTAEVHGGGVFIGGGYTDNGVTYPAGKFVMNGVTITGNKAGGGGGIGNGGTLELKSGVITGNAATKEKGGGVRNFKGASFSQAGGSVTGNTPDQIVTDQ